MIKSIYIISAIFFIFSCKHASYKTYKSEVKELTDQQYPDNKDIEVRSNDWDKYSHLDFEIKRNDKFDFTIKVDSINV